MENHNINYNITEIEERDLWTLEDVKNYLRVSHNKDDRLIGNLIKSAVVSAEDFLGLSLFTKKITCLVDKAPSYFKIKYVPVLRITAVNIINREDRVNITENFGWVNPVYSKILIDSRYLDKKLEITYEAGLGDRIPKNILQGILIHVGAMYDFGENSLSISAEVREIYTPYRKLKI